LITEARQSLAKAFESEEYTARREEILKSLAHQREEQFARLSEQAKKEDFILQSSPVGLLILPTKDGKPLSNEEFEALPPQMKKKLFHKKEKLDQEVVLFSVGHLVGELLEKYARLEKVVSFLQDVQNDILENLPQFRGETEGQPSWPFPIAPSKELFFRKYEVNVIIDNSSLSGAPVVMVLNPTYTGLLGKIERESHFGALVTDFTMIRAGSLHRANGGYLVLPLEEVLRNLYSWDALKRAIRNREISIEDLGTFFSMPMMKTSQSYSRSRPILILEWSGLRRTFVITPSLSAHSAVKRTCILSTKMQWRGWWSIVLAWQMIRKNFPPASWK